MRIHASPKIIFMILLAGLGMAFGAGELTLTDASSPVGKRGLIYKGRPVFLVGSGSFWLLNDPYYYETDGSTHLTHLRTHLDAYKPPSTDGKALGVIRVSAFGTPVRYSGVDHSRKRYPVKRISGQGTATDGGDKFDCTQFDVQFFTHVKTVAAEAESRGIILGIILWDEIPLETGSNGTRWRHNPFEPSNNINDYGLPAYSADGLPQFYTKPLDGTAQGNRLRDDQDAIVKKFCAELEGVPNVFFFIGNEYTGSDAWRDRQIQTIKDYNAANSTNFITVTMHYSGGPSDVSDGVALATSDAGTGNLWRSDGRPVICERDARGTMRITFWQRFCGGVASAGTRDDYSGNTVPSTMYTTPAAEDQQLRQFVNSLSSPLDSLVRDDSPFSSDWLGRVNPGREYAAYNNSSGGSITVDLSGETGMWKLYDWEAMGNTGAQVMDRGEKQAGSPVTWTVRSGECGVRIVNTSTVGFNSVPDSDLGGSLLQMYPNPANPFVRIKTRSKSKRIEIYNISGAKIAALVPDKWGYAVWNGFDSNRKPVPNGKYFVNYYDSGRIASKAFIVFR